MHDAIEKVTCIPFTRQTFIEEVHGASQIPGFVRPASQTLYLARYLESLSARTVIREERYIDRHFMEEVSLYYARCFTPPPNSCTRLHFFSDVLSRRNLQARLESALSGSREQVVEHLQKSYLGFVVVRPLKSAPIGRTILRPLNEGPYRQFPAVVDSSVHLLGFELNVTGLAFQQQDTGVAACATTAIWSALHRTRKAEGERQPPPSAITEAAVRHFIPYGRAIPSSGLTVEQVCEAFRFFGFPPEFFEVANSPDDFLLTLSIYLRSKIPVLLALLESGLEPGHAVTAVGYRRGNRVDRRLDNHTVRLLNLEFDELYVHDDRLGPYARAELLFPKRRGRSIGSSRLAAPPAKQRSLKLKIDWPDGSAEKRQVHAGIAPIYPKLRTSPQELTQTGATFLHFLKKVFPASDQWGIEMFFDRSGSYLASLFESEITAKRAAGFLKRVSLSRYVGVIRYYLGTGRLVDSLWDTTDRLRIEDFGQSLLGIVGYQERHTKRVEALATAFNKPWC